MSESPQIPRWWMILTAVLSGIYAIACIAGPYFFSERLEWFLGDTNLELLLRCYFAINGFIGVIVLLTVLVSSKQPVEWFLILLTTCCTAQWGILIIFGVVGDPTELGYFLVPTLLPIPAVIAAVFTFFLVRGIQNRRPFARIGAQIFMLLHCTIPVCWPWAIPGVILAMQFRPNRTPAFSSDYPPATHVLTSLTVLVFVTMGAWQIQSRKESMLQSRDDDIVAFYTHEIRGLVARHAETYGELPQSLADLSTRFSDYHREHRTLSGEEVLEEAWKRALEGTNTLDFALQTFESNTARFEGLTLRQALDHITLRHFPTEPNFQQWSHPDAKILAEKIRYERQCASELNSLETRYLKPNSQDLETRRFWRDRLDQIIQRSNSGRISMKTTVDERTLSDDFQPNLRRTFASHWKRSLDYWKDAVSEAERARLTAESSTSDGSGN